MRYSINSDSSFDRSNFALLSTVSPKEPSGLLLNTTVDYFSNFQSKSTETDDNPPSDMECSSDEGVPHYIRYIHTKSIHSGHQTDPKELDTDSEGSEISLQDAIEVENYSDMKVVDERNELVARVNLRCTQSIDLHCQANYHSVASPSTFQTWNTSHSRVQPALDPLSCPLSPHLCSTPNRCLGRDCVWMGGSNGDLEYNFLPSNLEHLSDQGNTWSYSNTSARTSCYAREIGDIHFAPSMEGGEKFQYWVCTKVGLDRVWCPCVVGCAHPVTPALILEHQSVYSAPQWIGFYDKY